MAIDHLLFNKLKWFNVPDNADSVSAGGRNYMAVPKSVTFIKWYSDLWNGNHKLSNVTEYPVIGVFQLGGQYTNQTMPNGIYYIAYSNQQFMFVNQADVVSAVWG